MSRRFGMSESEQQTNSLAAALRVGTKRAHRIVERVRFIRCFLSGVLDRTTYQHYLRDLHCLYQALEQELVDHLHHPAVGPLCLPILFRTSALADDLLTLHGTGWQHTLTASIPAQQYAIHLRQLSQQNPHLLVAHAYTRYLGDLAGGQILRAFAKLALGLSDQQGLSFYDFPQIADLAVMRDQYRRILDSLPLSSEQSAAVVTEAVRAFQMNQALLEAVDFPHGVLPAAAPQINRG